MVILLSLTPVVGARIVYFKDYTVSVEATGFPFCYNHKHGTTKRRD